MSKITAQLLELDKRLLQVMKDCDMTCDHSVGICCGFHYNGYRTPHGNPAPINKTALYHYARELRIVMKESDKQARKECRGAFDCYPPEIHAEVKAIIKAIRMLGGGK